MGQAERRPTIFQHTRWAGARVARWSHPTIFDTRQLPVGGKSDQQLKQWRVERFDNERCIECGRCIVDRQHGAGFDKQFTIARFRSDLQFKFLQPEIKYGGIRRKSQFRCGNSSDATTGFRQQSKAVFMCHHQSTRVRRDFRKLQRRNLLHGDFAGCRHRFEFDQAIVGKRLSVSQRDSRAARVVRIVVQSPRFKSRRFDTRHFQPRRNSRDHFVDRAAKDADSRITFPAECFFLDLKLSVRADKDQSLSFRFLPLYHPSQPHVRGTADGNHVVGNRIVCGRSIKFQIIHQQMSPRRTINSDLHRWHYRQLKGRRAVTAQRRQLSRHGHNGCELTDLFVSQKQRCRVRRITANERRLTIDLDFLDEQIFRSKPQHLPAFGILSDPEFHLHRGLLISRRYGNICLLSDNGNRDVFVTRIRAGFLQQRLEFFPLHHHASPVTVEHGVKLVGRNELFVGLRRFLRCCVWDACEECE